VDFFFHNIIISVYFANLLSLLPNNVPCSRKFPTSEKGGGNRGKKSGPVTQAFAVFSRAIRCASVFVSMLQ